MIFNKGEKMYRRNFAVQFVKPKFVKPNFDFPNLSIIFVYHDFVCNKASQLAKATTTLVLFVLSNSDLIFFKTQY